MSKDEPRTAPVGVIRPGLLPAPTRLSARDECTSEGCPIAVVSGRSLMRSRWRSRLRPAVEHLISRLIQVQLRAACLHFNRAPDNLCITPIFSLIRNAVSCLRGPHFSPGGLMNKTFFSSRTTTPTSSCSSRTLTSKPRPSPFRLRRRRSLLPSSKCSACRPANSIPSSLREPRNYLT